MKIFLIKTSFLLISSIVFSACDGTADDISVPTSCNEVLSLTASDDGTNDGNTPELAVDNNPVSTRWSSEGAGKWIKLDLGGEAIVTGLETAWYKADQRDAYFDVETSVDDSNWTTVISGGQSQHDTAMHKDDLPGDRARYIRVVGGGNSINDWNSLLEAKVYGCDYVASQAPTTPTIPIPTNITDNSTFDLEGANPSPLVDDETLVFLPLEAQHTTPNGHGWRHEYKVKSSLRTAMTRTYEEFSATVRVDMSTGGKTIVAQHHASDTGTIMKLYVSDTSESGFDDSIHSNGTFDVYVRMLGTSGSEEKKALGTIQSGDSFTFNVVNNYGLVMVEAFGKSFELEVEDNSASYFKFGNYLQSQDPNGSVNCGTGGDSASFTECYSQLSITESKITMTNVSYFRMIK